MDGLRRLAALIASGPIAWAVIERLGGLQGTPLPQPPSVNAAHDRRARRDVPIKAHNQSIEEVMTEYGLPNLEVGLTNKQVEQQRATHGYNRLTPPGAAPPQCY